jgi:hypothetical protein
MYCKLTLLYTPGNGRPPQEVPLPTTRVKSGTVFNAEGGKHLPVEHVEVHQFCIRGP